MIFNLELNFKKTTIFQKQIHPLEDGRKKKIHSWEEITGDWEQLKTVVEK